MLGCHVNLVEFSRGFIRILHYDYLDFVISLKVILFKINIRTKYISTFTNYNLFLFFFIIIKLLDLHTDLHACSRNVYNTYNKI